jgi:hypothetical protein
VFKKVVLEIATPKTPNDLTAEEWAALNKEMSDKFSAATRELLPF